jgi:hypothetical protein
MAPARTGALAPARSRRRRPKAAIYAEKNFLTDPICVMTPLAGLPGSSRKVMAGLD